MADIITSDTRIKITAASHPAHYRLGQLAIKAAALGLVLRLGSGLSFAIFLGACVLGTFGASAVIVAPALFISGPLTLVLMVASRAARLRARDYGRQLLALPKPE